MSLKISCKMVEFSKVNIKDVKDEGDDEEEEEPGEEIESAPPLKVGEEREIKSPFGCLRKKLLKRGRNWESPQFGDEVTVHYVGSLLDGTKFISGDMDKPFTFKLGHGQVVTGLDHGIITMRKVEKALFTLPPEVGYGEAGADGVPPHSIMQFEVELTSWITVVDVCRDGGIIKKIMEKGEQAGPPSDLDEVSVNYKVNMVDGTVVAKTPEEGVEFYVKDGHFCPALSKAIKTMQRGEKVNLIIQPQYAFGDVGKESVDEFPPVPPNSMLNIAVELSSIKPVIDVTGDMKVIKKILKEGEGVLTANEGASVTVRYIAKFEDGNVFERKGFDGGQPLEFITDEEQVIVGLDRAATTMKKGECAILTTFPEYGFGSSEVKRDLSIIPSSSTVVYEVEMLDFTREKAPWEMSNLEKIEAAVRKKEEGNQLFKTGNYQRAGKKYEKAAEYVSEGGVFMDDDQKLVESLRLSCWLNGAACNLKLNDFQEVIKLCSRVLDVESCNVKALYRRVQAYMEVGELFLAELDIKKALEVDPLNKEVKLIQKNLKKLIAESNKRDAKVYSAMFSHMTNDASNAVKRLKTAEEL